MPQICHCAAFAPDGQVLFVGDRNANVHLFSGFSAVFLCKEAGLDAENCGGEAGDEEGGDESGSEEEEEGGSNRK